MVNYRDNAESFPCPHCGHPVPVTARRCRHCGASEDCGWNDDAGFDSEYVLESEEDDFDYDQFVAREFPDQADRPLTTDQKPWVKLVVLFMIVSFVLTLLAF